MLEHYFIDENKLEYRYSKNAIGTSYFSYEKKQPLGTIRYINEDLCRLFQCYKSRKYRLYKLHWLKLTLQDS